jgi:hypothetical protein
VPSLETSRRATSRNIHVRTEARIATRDSKQARERQSKMTLRTVALASAAFACVSMLSLGWTEQGGVSLSSKAEAYTRLVVRPAYSAVYFHSADLPCTRFAPTITADRGAASATATPAGRIMQPATASRACLARRSRVATASCTTASKLVCMIEPGQGAHPPGSIHERPISGGSYR